MKLLWGLNTDKSASRPKELFVGIGLALALAWTSTASNIPSAEAAFPDRNGRIAFSAGTFLDPSGGRTPPGYAQFRDYDLFTIGGDGSGLNQLTQGPAIDGMPEWSPDGRRILFLRNDQSTGFEFDIFVMSAKGGSPVNLTNTPLYREWFPSWSPDGEQIVFMSDRATPEVVGRAAWNFFQGDLFVMNSDGSGLVQITSTPGTEAGPIWSPDGQWIAFFDPRVDAISLVRPDGTDRHVLSPESFRAEAPDWSPNGSEIVFTRYDGRQRDIWVINVETGRTRKLTNDEAGEAWPTWSPNGRYVIFVSNRDGRPRLYRMNSDGSHVENLVDLELPSDAPLDWGPRP